MTNELTIILQVIMSSMFWKVLLVIIVLVLILLYITPNKRIDKSKKMTDIQLYKIELHKLNLKNNELMKENARLKEDNAKMRNKIQELLDKLTKTVKE